MRRAAARTIRRSALLLLAVSLPACTPDRLVSPVPGAGPEPITVHRITATVGHFEGEAGRRQAIEMYRGDLARLEASLRAGQGDRARLERQIERTKKRVEVLTAKPPADAQATLPSAEEGIAEGDVRILEAATDVAIWDDGASSTGRVYASTTTDRYSDIEHTIGYSITVNGHTGRQITVTHSNTMPAKLLGTPISLNGLDCAVRTSVSANTQHHATAIFSAPANAYSQGARGCGPPPKAMCGDEPVDQEAVSSGDAATAGTDCVGGAAGGGEDSCRLFLITVHVSYDNGSTWFLQSQEVVEICDF